MLAATVEGFPLDGGNTSGTSVELDFLAMVLHNQTTSSNGEGRHTTREPTCFSELGVSTCLWNRPDGPE